MKRLAVKHLAYLIAAGVACAAPGLAEAVPFLPDFAAATFAPGAAVDHPYLPLVPGTFREYRNDNEGERFIHTVLSGRETILGVDAVILRDDAFEDDLLVERTFDYFAQDTAGNVWYLGEDVTNFIYDADGNLISTNSSSTWRAGVNGAVPGFIMPADLTIGFNYYQEFAPADLALDNGTSFAILAQLDLAIGTFFDVLQVFETTELDPDAREFKYYAPGIGLVLVDEALDENFEPAFSIPLVRQGTIPEPVLVGPLMIGMGLTLFLRRRREAWRAASV